jgi:hypothetical protein
VRFGCGRPERNGLDAGTGIPALPPTLSPNGGFALSLSLGAGLLVKAALPELGIQAGALHFALELPQRTFEVFALLNDDFQTNHSPEN